MFFLPTMNRPERLQEVLDACVKTGMTAPGLVILNGVDQCMKYRHVKLPANWQMTHLVKNKGFNGAMNWAWDQHSPDLEWYGCMADDAVPQTEGWDQKIIAHLKDYAMVSTNDGWQCNADPMVSRISPTSVFDAGMLKAMGFWFLPGLWSCYADDILEGLGRYFGFWKIDMDVMAEHKHVLNKKAPNDKTYDASYASKQSMATDQAIYNSWLMGRSRVACMERLAAYWTARQQRKAA